MDEAPQQTTPQPEQGKDNPVERRIAQLVAQRKEAEERAAALTANTTALQEQVLRLTEELATVNATPSTPKPESLAGQSSGTDVVKAVDERLRAWENSFVERENKQRAFVALQQAQALSAAQASQEFPEVANKDGQLFQVADRLFRNMPELQRAPNGPYQAIVMARGLLVGATAEQPDPRKVAAATGPMGASGAPALDKPAAKKEIEALMAQHKEAVNALKNGTGDLTKNYVTQRHIEKKLRELGFTDF